uniref:Uncharacterized protein n=1 Tax=Nelumbo nucifera TaxID=4432 RepID=A0A822Y9Z7_NELNU|nr:TPA_asm: hypothetical protein HUJ06_029424 [Nelumbo nucifera]
MEVRNSVAMDNSSMAAPQQPSPPSKQNKPSPNSVDTSSLMSLMVCDFSY